MLIGAQGNSGQQKCCFRIPVPQPIGLLQLSEYSLAENYLQQLAHTFQIERSDNFSDDIMMAYYLVFAWK